MTNSLQGAGGKPSGRFWKMKGSPVFVFRVVAVGIMLSTIVGIVFAVRSRSAFVNGFPGAGADSVYVGFLTVGMLGLIALGGLLRWQMWALMLYGIQTLASI